MKFGVCVVLLACMTVLSNCGKDDPDGPAPKPVAEPKPIIFASLDYGTVKDADGNSYKTIRIGNQTWMAENLRTTVFADGSPIATGLTTAEWTSATSPAVCNYEDNSANASLYGSLYNQYVVTDSRKVCPGGWHVPSANEWNQLGNHLGGMDEAGTGLKETGTTHWYAPNTGSNSSGFTGLPGGSRYRGRYADMGTDGYWWSSNKERFFYTTNTMANLRTKATAVGDDGLAIRCVQD